MKSWTKVFAVVLIIIGCLCLIPAATEGVSAKKGLTNPFFAFKSSMKGPQYSTPKSQARVLKELGYAGIEHSGVHGIAEMLEELDKNGLKMFTVYIKVCMDGDKEKHDPALKEAVRTLKGRDTILWLYVTSQKYKPSCLEADPPMVEVIREIADMAHESGLRVALYPHLGYLVERVEDAVRMAEKVNRRNVGVTFNLCHWLAKTTVDEEKNLESVLKSAIPYLFVVSINGADNKKGWDNLIQTLDRGSFDTYNLLKTLKRLGYTGPIGLQCYNIKGDTYNNLNRSMQAWRKFSERIAADEN